jgi:HD-like signal output (HDOD) protein/DNA-binding CsgD family transcriptional regulator
LRAAFEEFKSFPALRQTRDEMLRLARDPKGDHGPVAAVVESDPALTIAVLRAAGRTASGSRPVTIGEALALLSPEEVEAVAEAVEVFDFFEQSRIWSEAAERFRVHARVTQAAILCVRRSLGHPPRPDLQVAGLLHDIGKLVLLRAHDRYEPIWNSRGRADDRLRLERAELGVDHAMVGGVLARRLRLPGMLASTIEHHHNPHATGDAAIVRLADMLAHYATGDPVDPAALSAAARTAGMSGEDLRAALEELPGGGCSETRPAAPSPLTERETEMVQKLAAGKHYKQIAADFGLSVSTVRTHLCNTYRKLDVGDRAQAVLLATSRGWL